MQTIIYTGGMVLLWLSNLLNGTGLGAAYNTTEYTRLAVVAAVFLLLFDRIFREKVWYASKRYFYTLIFVAAVFMLVPQFKGHGWRGFDYLWVFLVTFLLAQTRPDRKAICWTGAIYAALGLAILFIFNYMDALDGWNPNSIAMIGLFSYLVFMIPYYGVRDWQSVVMLTLVGAAYVALIWPTGSRSCCIAIVLALLMTFRIAPAEKLLGSRKKLFTALQVPLMVALLGCVIALTADLEILNNWSTENLGKTFFNGRDQIWLDTFRGMESNLLFGSGYISNGLYHNSAVACLAAYGVVGYILWILLFHVILSDALPHQQDVCVMGATTAFFIIFWQQSLELGLFSASPNLIPYVVLGVMLGRVGAPKEQECQK